MLTFVNLTSAMMTPMNESCGQFDVKQHLNLFLPHQDEFILFYSSYLLFLQEIV